MENTDNSANPPQDGSALIGEFLQRAVDVHNNGDLETAEALYRKILEIDPQNADVLHLLGFLAYQVGFGEEGAALIEEAIQLAPEIALFQSNLAKIYLSEKELEKAEIAYRRSLELNPDDLDIMNDLGNLLREKEKGPGTDSLNESIKLLSEVVRQNPASPEFQVNYGNALRNNLQLDEAKDCYVKALEINPEFSGALVNLGTVYQMKKDSDEAKSYFNKALELDPKNSGALNNFAQVLVAEHRLDEGIEYFKQAAEIEPNNPLVYYNMGMALMRRRRDDEALEVLQKSMELDNHQPRVFCAFSALLRMMDNLEAAERFTRDSLEQFPEDPHLLNELSHVLMSNFEFDEAEELARAVLKENPNFGPALIVLAIVLIHTGTEEEILDLYKKAFELMPDEQVVPFNYALTMFCFGHLEEAWKHYRSRWDTGDFTSPVRSFPQKLWDGSSLEGKSIVIYGEQGLGDEIRHASMVPDMLTMGADVTVECEKRLVDLFQRSFPSAKVEAFPYQGAESGEVDFDFQSPILDLGEFLRPTIESFPSDPNHAFLVPDPDRKVFWGDRMKQLGPTPKVGMIWRSGTATGGRNRWGATVEELAPIFSIQGLDFVNLMYTECSEDRARIQELYGVNLHTWDDIDLKDDQDDLAALVSNLDLVISHPSAVAYLASGMAVPTFTFMTVMNYFDLLGNPDAPGWAPSMRYFRKKIYEEWDDTLNTIAAEVRAKFGL